MAEAGKSWIYGILQDISDVGLRSKKPDVWNSQTFDSQIIETVVYV